MFLIGIWARMATKQDKGGEYFLGSCPRITLLSLPPSPIFTIGDFLSHSRFHLLIRTLEHVINFFFRRRVRGEIEI